MRFGLYGELTKATQLPNNALRHRNRRCLTFLLVKPQQRESEDNSNTMNELQWPYFGIVMVMMIDDERKQTKYTKQTSENVKLIKIDETSVLCNFTFGDQCSSSVPQCRRTRCRVELSTYAT
jgi:hypothetical protein